MSIHEKNMNHEAPERKVHSIEEVRTLLDAAVTVPYTVDTRRVCVDGRGTLVQSQGLALPGATFGYVGALLAGVAKLKLGESVARFAIDYTGSKMKVEYHTDDHSQGESHVACAGCGHAMGLATNEAYGLGEFRHTLFDSFGSLDAENQTVLKGAHEEGAVVLIEDDIEADTLTYIPHVHNGVSVFVANLSRAKKELGELAAAFATERGIEVDTFVSEVAKAFEVQTMTTLGRLAKGLPIYSASVKAGKIVSLDKVGIV